MKALVLRQIKQPLAYEDRPEPRPGAGEVVVELRMAALNRRDLWITLGLYPGVKTPVILGSDGAGVIVKKGEGVGAAQIGREVILDPALGWGASPSAQAADFRILGMPDDGTFATAVAVAESQIYSKPDHLDWTEAAALPLAGLTAYRALFTQGQLRSGAKVLITGIGGGVATFALQFALARGAEVSVTSSSTEKIGRAIELGAAAGQNYSEEGWAQRLLADRGPMDLIIDSAGGKGYRDLLDLAAPGGRIVNYGATAGPPEGLDLFKIFWKQLHLVGSTMGSPAEFQAMLELVNTHHIRPVVDRVFPLKDGNLALNRMQSSEQCGKLVLSAD